MVVPFLLLLLIGSIEIGRALRYYHVVKESLRDAARYLSRVPILISFSCSLVSDQRPFPQIRDPPSEFACTRWILIPRSTFALPGHPLHRESAENG